jgi:hypothetical protein
MLGTILAEKVLTTSKHYFFLLVTGISELFILEDKGVLRIFTSYAFYCPTTQQIQVFMNKNGFIAVF